MILQIFCIQHCQHILGAGIQSIYRRIADGCAGTAAFYQLVNQLAESCLSQIHVMVNLELNLRIVMIFFRNIVFLFPEFHNNTLLIDNQPVFDSVTVSADQELAVSHEILYTLAVYPSVILVNQCHWHIIMVNCRYRLNSIGNQLVYQVIVELKSFWIHLSRSIRENSGPGERKAICCKSTFLHQSNIFFIAMIMIAGYAGICKSSSAI